MKHAIISVLYMVCEVAYFLIIFGIPWRIFRRPIEGHTAFFLPRFLQSILAVWGVLILFHLLIGRQVAWVRAQEYGDLMNDGVGVTGGILLMGWVIGLFGATVSWLVFYLVRSVKERKAEQTEKYSSAHPPSHTGPGGS